MSGPPGRDRLLDAAEKLFAEQGIEATSARAINAAAGLSPAALHYHFGNKDKIVAEVLLRRVGALNERRLAMVDDAQRDGVVLDVYKLAEIFVLPLADLALADEKVGQAYARFLSRLYTERATLTVQFFEQNFVDTIELFDRLIGEAVPGLPIDEVRMRRIITVESAVHYLAHICEIFENEPDGRARAEPMLRSLIAFLAGGLAAPVSS